MSAFIYRQEVANNSMANAPAFYEYLQNRILVRFQPKNGDSDPKAVFESILTRKMTYDQVGLLIFLLL